MSPNDLNFRHLLYFWAVAKEGSITRAAERLNLSVQTISTQLGVLEQQLGQALFAPQGRSLVLTDAGRAALDYADQIFLLGERLRHAVADHGSGRRRFAVGLTEAVPKLVAFRLLQPALKAPLAMRIECIESSFEQLLSELALNRLDLVLADRAAPTDAHLKLQSRLLGTVGIDLYAAEPLHQRYVTDFPRGLNGAPVLLPLRSNPLRGAIDGWFARNNLKPELVGEFSDSALLKTFGRAGLGLFPAPSGMHADILTQFGARSLGALNEVRENWYAIVTQRRIPHPAVEAVEAGGIASLLA
ncbi:MAG: LysR family transcriptional regulator [Rhodocyclaceae bacterium]|jgi:LysR family transcriptional activator of nhaA|nr:LysR family transcriptional regulator [Rhodocyclaceae bacterium]